MIEIEASGPLATAQDLGRAGQLAVGVPRSGAFDRAALRLANRLVGNGAGAAGVEVTFGGLAFVTDTALTIACTGAVCAGAPDWGVAVTLPGGTRVRLGSPAVGLRSYLAVRGGVDVPATLGSRSTDTLSGLGPAPLSAGDRLAVGSDWTVAVSDARTGATRIDGPLRVHLGPRTDWFTAGARRDLLDTVWTVRGESDRVGVRLDGPPLARARDGELPSEPMLPGALQVPPDGRPILFGPDAPVTGGYPVIAVVADADLDRAAQLRPGDPVRLRTTS